MTTIALIYDFDGTLSPSNMQEYDFLKAIGITDKALFWNESRQLMEQQNANNVLCYMKLMIEKSREKHIPINRCTFQGYGDSIELYPGVEQWFRTINEYGESQGVRILHYINSSGLKEMIEGSRIAHEFEEIYACSFMYDENGVAVWPAVAVDFTTKTQFLFMINKGIRRISDNQKVNQYVPDSERPIPFDHMVYLGDGETDIPCMKLVKQYGGRSIAVYNGTQKEKKLPIMKKLLEDGRVNYFCEADYQKEASLYQTVCAIIRKIKAEDDLEQIAQENKEK